jgi:hypothetical protein
MKNLILIVLVESPRLIEVEVENTYVSMEIQERENLYFLGEENLVLILVVESPRMVGVGVDDTYESMEIQKIENLYFLGVETDLVPCS